MLMMLAFAGRLRPSKGPADADDARPCQLMLMMLAPQGPTDADDARLCRAPQAQQGAN